MAGTARSAKKATGGKRANARLDPAALTPNQAAELLRVDIEAILDDVRRGAPIGADGRINLVHYAAWLVRQTGSP